MRKKLNLPIHSKNPGRRIFSHFACKTWFSKDLALSCTTPHGPLTPCWVSEKTKKSIPRKFLNRRTDRPYSYDPSCHGQGCYKRISQLREIAVDNKTKVQCNSAYHIYLSNLEIYFDLSYEITYTWAQAPSLFRFWKSFNSTRYLNVTETKPIQIYLRVSLIILQFSRKKCFSLSIWGNVFTLQTALRNFLIICQIVSHTNINFLISKQNKKPNIDPNMLKQ